jgi:hypothetical protein
MLPAAAAGCCLAASMCSSVASMFSSRACRATAASKQQQQQQQQQNVTVEEGVKILQAADLTAQQCEQLRLAVHGRSLAVTQPFVLLAPNSNASAARYCMLCDSDTYPGGFSAVAGRAVSQNGSLAGPISHICLAFPGATTACALQALPSVLLERHTVAPACNQSPLPAWHAHLMSRTAPTFCTTQ